MTPVIRLAVDGQVGGIEGTISDPPDVSITVSSLISEQSDIYSGTVPDEDGYFLLAYMEPGVYDVLIEAPGFEPIFLPSVEVVPGEIVNLNEIFGELYFVPIGGGGQLEG